MFRARRSSSSSLGSGKSQDTAAALPGDKSGKRRRGRPRGNPVPLNQEERRQRNAQYERERRVEMADAMKELAEAMGMKESENVSNAHLLASVLLKLQRHQASPPEDVVELRRTNDDLMAEVEKMSALLSGVNSVSSSSSLSTSPDLQMQELNNFVGAQLPEASLMPQYPQASITCLREDANREFRRSPSTSTSSYASYGTSYCAATWSPELQDDIHSPVSLDFNFSLTAASSSIAQALPPPPLVTSLPEPDAAAVSLPDLLDFDAVPAFMDDEDLMEMYTNLIS